MAKPTSPLMSFQASGKIGQRLVFSVRSSGQQVRFQKSQKDIKTLPRLEVRSAYSSSVFDWVSLPDIDKNIYVQRAKSLHMTGYNLFIKENISFGSAELGIMFLGSNFLGVS